MAMAMAMTVAMVVAVMHIFNATWGIAMLVQTAMMKVMSLLILNVCIVIDMVDRMLWKIIFMIESWMSNEFSMSVIVMV